MVEADQGILSLQTLPVLSTLDKLRNALQQGFQCESSGQNRFFSS